MPGSSTLGLSRGLYLLLLSQPQRGGYPLSLQLLNVYRDNSHQLFPAVILLLFHNVNGNSLIRMCLTGIRKEKMCMLPVARVNCDSVAN